MGNLIDKLAAAAAGLFCIFWGGVHSDAALVSVGAALLGVRVGAAIAKHNGAPPPP